MTILYQHSPPSFKQGYARSASESAAPNLWKGLVVAWVPSLGPTGLPLFDVSGNRNHGTLSDMDPATDWVVGGNPRFPGYVLDFEGGTSDERVRTALGVDMTSWTGTSHSLWFKRTGSDVSDFYTSHLHSGADDIALFINSSGEIVYGLDDGTRSDVTGSAITQGVWEHAVGTFDGTNQILYFNGKEVASGTDGFDFSSASDSQLSIGARLNGGLEAPVQISSFLLYDRELTFGEIRQLYDDPMAPFRRRLRVSHSELVAAAAGGLVFKKRTNTLLRM